MQVSRRIAAWRKENGQIRTVYFQQAVSFRENAGHQCGRAAAAQLT
jgi:hypothetical protein